MSTAATASAPTPQPAPAVADQPGRIARLLSPVGRLIVYGQRVAAALEQSGAAGLDRVIVALYGTDDLTLILARITRGLLGAQALAARLRAMPEDALSWCAGVLAPRASGRRNETADRERLRPARPRAVAAAIDPANLLTLEEIAAQDRRRPIGGVLADTCRDLGITPEHPLFGGLGSAILLEGGDVTTLSSD